MKIALLGAGKTGGKVIDVVGKDNVTVFDSDNKPTAEKLVGHDCVVSFLPGPALLDYISMLLDAELPLVSGSTGFDWPNDIDQKLKDNGIVWVTASNFALGMNLIKAMIDILGQNTPKLFDDYGFALHEVHHVHKKDHPSGTALTWQKWLGLETYISSGKLGDTVGDHKLTLDTPYEQISLQHVAKNRAAFAEGAVWTAKKVLAGAGEPGLNYLQDIMKKELGL